MEYEKAKELAAKLISYKMYTCKEVFERLMQKGCKEETAQEVVSQFCRAGILNDEEYARLYIHDALTVNLKGIYRVKQELIQKGVASVIIERAISESEIDQMALLFKYTEIKFMDKTFSTYPELEKAKAHLVRRGFGISDINKCFKELGVSVGGGDID